MDETVKKLEDNSFEATYSDTPQPRFYDQGVDLPPHNELLSDLVPAREDLVVHHEWTVGMTMTRKER